MTISRFFRTAFAFIALGAALVQPARADIIQISGDTTGGGAFHRAVSDFSSLSTIGTHVRWNAITFTVTEEGEYSFVGGSDEFDTLLFLYKWPFDAAHAMHNGIVGSDDLVSTATSGVAAQLDAGTRYVLVVTGYNNSDYGNYAYLAIGPGTVTLVPEPSAWLMLGAGLALVGWSRRRAFRH